MSKSIFVIDTPGCCGACPMSGTGVCRKWNMKDAHTFPKECPLKEIPQKKPDRAMGEWLEFNNGYNACIDKIMGFRNSRQQS